MLTLRPYRESDRADFVSLVTDAAVMRAMDGAMSGERAHARFDAFLRQEDTPALLVRAAESGGAYVGHGFLVEREELGGVEIGFIVAPQHQRRGHGTAIARGLLDLGFGAMKLRRVLATVDADNLASMRVLENAGFEDRGTREDEHGPFALYCIER